MTGHSFQSRQQATLPPVSDSQSGTSSLLRSRWWSLENFSIKTRQTLFAATIVCMMLVSFGLLLVQVQTVQVHLNDVLTNWLPSITITGQIRSYGDQVRRRQLRLLSESLNDSTLSVYHHMIDSSLQSLQISLVKYEPLQRDEDRASFQKTLRLWKLYSSYHPRFIDLMAAGRRDEASVVLNRTADPIFQQFLAAIAETIRANELGAQHSAEKIEQAYMNIRWLLITFGVVVCGLTLVLSRTLALSIIRPAEALKKAADEVSRGNHDIDIPDFGRNEFGDLGDSFRAMNAALHRNVLVQQGLNELSAALRGDKDTTQLTHDILRFLAAKLDIQSAALYVMHKDKSSVLTLVNTYAMNLPSDRGIGLEVPFGDGIVGQAALDRTSLRIDDIPPDNIRGYSRLAGDIVPRYVMAFPFVYQDVLVGVLELWKLRAWTEDQLYFLQMIAEPIAVGLQTARNKAAMVEQNLTLAAANEEIQRQIEIQAAQSREIEYANARLEEQMLELAAAKEEIEKQVEVQAEQQHQLEIAYVEMEEKNQQLATAKLELERQMEEQAEQQRALERSMMELHQTNWELIEAKEEILRQAAIQDEQAREIEIANTALQEKNLQIEHTLAQLKQAQQQLVQNEKMAGLGQLTAGIAHEINNPVTFISGAIKPLRRNLDDVLQVLAVYEQISERTSVEEIHSIMHRVHQMKQELELDELLSETRDLLKSMDSGASRIAEIVKGLRNFSRLDEHDLKTVDIHEGIDSTLTILRSQYKDHIEIVRQYGDLPLIECYAGQLNQVFMNIIANAIQAIETTGTITIATSLKSTKERQQYAVISIRDTGKGIPPDVQQRIFEPFFTTKDVGKGTGLGLSISFSIIDKHNGTITVNSEVGKGTEFVITLPVKHSS
jgi:signal transduction histidine kinase